VRLRRDLRIRVEPRMSATEQQEAHTMVKPIPNGYPRVTPYLIVDDGSAAIEFYREVLEATERMRMPTPDDKVGHAELEIGDSLIMLADESPDMDARAPTAVGGTPVTLHVYVEDADTVFDRAVGAGAKALRPVEDKFYGDRSGEFEDPFGHRWSVATHVEDVSPDEMEKRMAAAG
jgi:PhnB protein